MEKTKIQIAMFTMDAVVNAPGLILGMLTMGAVAKEIFMRCDKRNIAAHQVSFVYTDNDCIEINVVNDKSFFTVLSVKQFLFGRGNNQKVNSFQGEAKLFNNVEQSMISEWLHDTIDKLMWGDASLNQSIERFKEEVDGEKEMKGAILNGVVYTKEEVFNNPAGNEKSLSGLMEHLFTRFVNYDIDEITVLYFDPETIDVTMYTKGKGITLFSVNRSTTKKLLCSQNKEHAFFNDFTLTLMADQIGELFDIPCEKWKTAKSMNVVRPPNKQKGNIKRIVALENCLHITGEELTTTVITNGIMARYVAMGTPLAQVNVIRKGLFCVQVEGNGAKLFTFYKDPSLGKDYIGEGDYFHDKEINEMKSWLLNNFYHEEE